MLSAPLSFICLSDADFLGTHSAQDWCHGCSGSTGVVVNEAQSLTSGSLRTGGLV